MPKWTKLLHCKHEKASKSVFTYLGYLMRRVTSPKVAKTSAERVAQVVAFKEKKSVNVIDMREYID